MAKEIGKTTFPQQIFPPDGRRKLSKRLLLTAAGMALSMTVYESLKQLLFPGITVRQSHIVTICFSTFVAIIVAYFVLLRTDQLLCRISGENILRQKMQDDLRVLEQKFSKLFHANPGWVIISNLHSGRYLDVNSAVLRMTGFSREEIVGHTSLELHIWVDPEDRETIISKLFKEGRLHNHEVKFRMKSGEIRTLLRSAELIHLNGEPVMISVCKDITDRNQAALERERLIDQLEDSLSKVKLLSGMLPTCASCKKIRDDKGQWLQMESYIKDRSDADFSHGVCPDCAEKLYPDFYNRMRNRPII